MKRLLSIFAFVLVACMSMNAQDIILKTDGTEIQALVEEISETSVRYKLFSNPNGPVRVMEVTSIFRISFADGSVEIFTTPEKAASLKSNDNKFTRENIASLPWDLRGDKIYVGSYYLPDAQLRQFDSGLYSAFKSGRNMHIAGEIIWAGGLGLGVGSVIGGFAYGFDNASLIELGVATSLVILGGALDISGSLKMQKVINTHNNTLSLSLAPSLLSYHQVNTANMKFAPGLTMKISF